jgi:two-component system, chemotaxis family, sensor kinase CheA
VNALLEQFLLESRELVLAATDDLVALERSPADRDCIDRVFRAFHTLKGGAAIADLPVMTHLLHTGEDVLSALRKNEIASSPAVIDAALRCIDLVGRWLDEIEASGGLPENASNQAALLEEGLRRLLPLSGTDLPVAANTEFDWVGSLLAATPGISGRLDRTNRTGIVAIAYQPHANCFFNGDDPIGLLRKVPQLVALRVQPRLPWPARGAMNPFECNLEFYALSLAPRSQIAEIFRLVADQIRMMDVAPDPVPAKPTGQAGSGNIVRSVLQAQRELLALPSAEKEYIGRVGAAAQSAINVLRFAKAEADANRVERARDDALAKEDSGPLLDTLDDLLAQDAVALPAAGPGESTPTPSGVGGSLTGRTFRVDETKVDQLVNVAGELIVLKNGLHELVARMIVEFGEGETTRTLKNQVAAIDRQVNEAHRAIVQLRMVPLAQAFRRFPRLIRDAAQELGKTVGYTLRGDDTEADKSIVDALFEPLQHLVRNALVHGIEGPSERLARGKPESAHVSLSALRRGDQLVIEVADDGRGVDPDAVRRKAREQSLVAEADVEQLSDEQAIQLVFLPGFSTAAEVSQMSGRGVGLAAVRSAAEHIGGSVNLSSELGRGTTVRLALPLSMALVRIMTVQSGGQVFGVPIEAVAETVRLPRDRLIEIKNGQAFVLRDQIVPTCPLNRLLELPDSEARAHAKDALILVTNVGGQTAGVEIDGIGERLDVVMKPMQGILAEAPDYAGTTLLGNGQVLLVLNLSAMLQ